MAITLKTTALIRGAFVRISSRSTNSCKEKLLASAHIIPFHEPANSLEMTPKWFHTNKLCYCVEVTLIYNLQRARYCSLIYNTKDLSS